MKNLGNLGQMMKQVQEMQARMQDMQAKLADLRIVGQSGGGLVKLTLNGKGSLVQTEIDQSLLKAEEREILEDLIVAAHNDAKTKMEQVVGEQMKQITGGLALPPGLQFPF